MPLFCAEASPDFFLFNLDAAFSGRANSSSRLPSSSLKPPSPQAVDLEMEAPIHRCQVPLFILCCEICSLYGHIRRLWDEKNPPKPPGYDERHEALYNAQVWLKLTTGTKWFCWNLAMRMRNMLGVKSACTNDPLSPRAVYANYVNLMDYLETCPPDWYEKRVTITFPRPGAPRNLSWEKVTQQLAEYGNKYTTIPPLPNVYKRNCRRTIFYCFAVLGWLGYECSAEIIVCDQETQVTLAESNEITKDMVLLPEELFAGVLLKVEALTK